VAAQRVEEAGEEGEGVDATHSIRRGADPQGGRQRRQRGPPPLPHVKGFHNKPDEGRVAAARGRRLVRFLRAATPLPTKALTLWNGPSKTRHTQAAVDKS
jgi:hypothetical protein